jgi:hypothetical protein
MPKKVYLMMAVAVALGFLGGAFLTAISLPDSNAFAQVSNTKATKILHPEALPTEQSEIQKEVQAMSFKLYNGSKLIATLATSKDGMPELNFYDPRTNQNRLKIYLEDSFPKTTPGLIFYDDQGKHRALFTLNQDNEGYLVFFDQSGNIRFQVNTTFRHGEPVFGGLSYTLQEDKFFSITCDPNTTGLVLQHGKGRRLIQPPVNQSVIGY